MREQFGERLAETSERHRGHDRVAVAAHRLVLSTSDAAVDRVRLRCAIGSGGSDTGVCPHRRTAAVAVKLIAQHVGPRCHLPQRRRCRGAGCGVRSLTQRDGRRRPGRARRADRASRIQRRGIVGRDGIVGAESDCRRGNRAVGGDRGRDVEVRRRGRRMCIDAADGEGDDGGLTADAEHLLAKHGFHPS